MVGHVKYYLHKEIKADDSFNTHSKKSLVYSFNLGLFFFASWDYPKEKFSAVIIYF